MKKHLYTIAIIAFVLSTCSCTSSSSSSFSSSFNKAIKGDGNIITQEVKIGSYNAINLHGSTNIIYEQKSSASPYLTIEIDKNLFEYIDIKVEGNRLHVMQKSGSSISPTKDIVVRTNSKELKEASILGSGDITILNKIKSDKLYFTIKGSGDINVSQFEAQSMEAVIQGSGNIKLEGKSTSAEFRVAGSGDITAPNLVTSSITAQINGSGGITLNGKSTSAEYRVNGSGGIDGKAFITQSAICNVAGSGSITVNAKEKLNNTITSSGSIRYAGNPQITNSVKGSGSVNAL